MIDGIPERFFYGDEPAEQIVESANREAVIKKQNDNFKKAFNEAKERRKEEQAKEEENSARRREIEFIDEQVKFIFRGLFKRMRDLGFFVIS